MLRIVTAALITAATAFTATACSKDEGPSCAQVVEHTAKLIGMELPADQRKEAVARCEKEPASVRSCALKSTTVEALMACKPS